MEGLKHEEVFDVVVIGDGTAGIAAALFCLQQGLKTVLVGDSNLKQKEKSKQGTVESIHPGVLTRLFHLKINSDFTSAKLGTYSYICNGVERISLNPYTEEIWQGFHISKVHFSNHLMIEARKQNLSILQETIEKVIVKDGRIVGVKTNSGIDIFSKYTIDGSVSRFTGILKDSISFYPERGVIQTIQTLVKYVAGFEIKEGNLKSITKNFEVETYTRKRSARGHRRRCASCV